MDLVPGSRPMLSIHENLRGADAGVLLITRSNQTEPWINYEAGVLAQRVLGKDKPENLVIPLLIDGTKTTEITGPLADLQNASFTESGMLKVIKGLASPSGTPEDIADKRFKAHWAGLKSKFDQIMRETDPILNAAPVRTDGDKIDEILERVRRLDPPPSRTPTPLPSEWSYTSVVLEDPPAV